MLLNERQIRQHLESANFDLPISCHVLSTIDSTNQFLKELPGSPEVTLCCAETQTQGRGRFQRAWFSPHAENIYCSIRWQIPNPSTVLSALSLVIGLAVLQTLDDLGIHQDITIKWPNDILWQEKKLCGILIESTQNSQYGLQIIAGIGLNVNSDPQQHHGYAAPKRPWCSLFEITQTNYDRNAIIAKLIIYAQHYMTQFLAEGFEPFMPVWQKYDYLYHKWIHVTHAKQSIQGQAHGVTQLGELIITDQTQQVHYLRCGEASIGDADNNHHSLLGDKKSNTGNDTVL